MKTQLLRVSGLVLTIGSLILCAGCEEERVQAEVPHFTPASVGSPGPVADAPNPTPVLESPKVILESTNDVPEPPPSVTVVQAPVPPPEAQTSPALAEVVKLVQAGVGEEVILAYIKNTPEPFNVSSDQVVYLNDIGVSPAVISSLLEHQPGPGAATANPNVLPPNLALTTPAANIYPASFPAQWDPKLGIHVT